MDEEQRIGNEDETAKSGQNAVDGRKATQFKKGNPGKRKGVLNKSTLFKNAIYDGITLAAKRLAKAQGRNNRQAVAKYVADMLTDPTCRLGILKMGTTMVPKELLTENVDRVNITYGPDEDCETDEHVQVNA